MRRWARNLIPSLCLLAAACLAGAQAMPTATQMARLSVFAGFTGADVGLGASQNIGATAGADFQFRRFFGLQPGVEVRGIYGTSGHVVASNKSVLGGVRVGHTFGRITPYGDALFGRGILDYGDGGYANANRTLLYTHTAGNVFSPGAGFDVSLSERFSFKADGQYQRFSTPVNTRHYIYVTPITFGLEYKFNFNHHVHFDRRQP